MFEGDGAQASSFSNLKFSEMYDIPSYSINKDAGLIQDNQTGEIVKMDSKKQSHIKIIK